MCDTDVQMWLPALRTCRSRNTVPVVNATRMTPRHVVLTLCDAHGNLTPRGCMDGYTERKERDAVGQGRMGEVQWG